MKVLVAGASGIVGRCLVDLLNRENIEVIQTYNKRKIEGGYKVNFINEKELETFFETVNPTHCVNCIVERFTDVCEKDWQMTKKANIDIPNILSRVCQTKGVKLVHISTDYVFDGRKPPFFPTSEVNPLQNYGISKLIAEKRVVANQRDACIIRVPVLYSNLGESLEENAVTVIGKKVLNQIEKTSEDATSVRRPVYIPDFCKFIVNVLKRNYSGIYHFYNPYDKTTKYEMAKGIGEYLELSTDHIEPADATGADRPHDTQLMDEDYDIYEYSFISIKEGIKSCFSSYWHPSISAGNKDNLFILLDLDGTLIDSEELHYESYKKAYAGRGKEFTREDFHKVLNESGTIDVTDVREEKNILLRSYKGELKWKAGAEKFLTYLIREKFNFAIVTNTQKENVDYFKTKFPLLTQVHQWVTREDTPLGKPNKAPYEKAIELYQKNTSSIVLGFENTVNGVKSLLGVTKRVYCLTNQADYSYKIVKNMDVRMIEDFTYFKDIMKQDI